LQSTGTWTFQRVFSGALEDRLRELLKSERNLRIAWKWSSALALLPWETLHVPPVGPSLGLDRRVSLVRYHPAGVSGTVQALRPPLRMLVVMASPRGAPRLNIAREEAMLRDTLASDPRVKLNFLTGSDATIENISARLQNFEPQLFHLVAHGFRRPGSATDLLLLSRPDGQGHEVSSSELAPLLGRSASGRSSVQLAVLNACDTGRSEFGNAVAGIAGEMVVSGLPAAIATTRRVLDPSAILFAREFYRTYLAGHPLEAALVEARLALNANDWDWSAYTLLTGIPDLDHFTLSSLPAQRSIRGEAPAARHDDSFTTSG
jgi:hypothetical protein